MKKKKKFYITTPIYYVNDKPSVGTAYTTVTADIIARWHRLKDEDVFYLTGLDENAQKTVQASIKLGFKDIKKFTDFMAEEYLKTWKALNISNDDFIRTTEERHHKLVTEFVEKIKKKGDIYKGTYSGLYCEGCEAFKTEDDLVNGLCLDHLKEPKYIEEQNYFFKLSKYQDKISKHIKENPDFIQPNSRRNEIINFLNKGLKDLSITRQSMNWGIPFPGDEKTHLYVWFDALTNYLHPKEYWPANIHLMGKDIVRFHALTWIGMLLSANYKLPKKVFAHGFFTVNGQKMSKTLGNIIDPVYLVNKYGVDALRYFYAREIPFGNDGDFSEESLKTRLNNELANELGNLVSRTLAIIEKKLNSEIRKDSTDKTLFKNLDVKKIDKFMETLEIHNAIAAIMGFVQDCNSYINDNAPWQIEEKSKLNKILYNLTDAIRIISILIYPFMPSTSEKINKQLQIEKNQTLEYCKPGLLKNLFIKKGDILFTKVLTKEEEQYEAKFNNTKCYVDQDVVKLGIKVKFAELIGLNIKRKHMGLEKLKDEIEHNFKVNEKVLEGYNSYYKKLDIKNGKCSVYNLIELVQKGGKLPTINTAVDSYNLVSLKKSLVVGAHDREKIKGSVRFKILNGTEFYIPLFKTEREEVITGEFGCVDDEKVLCRLDIKQGDQTKVTEETKNLILYVQGNEFTSDQYLNEALEEICNLIIKFCGGEYRMIE
ncbi:methionine--tRNA ligase [Candidatus Woesearchaeota archaeon]|nr:methionine--tRNA ligase [Candidatus Woesearchaeota archaeon]